MDIAILRALLKANKSSSAEGRFVDQLKLALAWNRADVAISDIMDKSRVWEVGLR